MLNLAPLLLAEVLHGHRSFDLEGCLWILLPSLIEFRGTGIGQALPKNPGLARQY
jgi:hypothetical protein